LVERRTIPCLFLALRVHFLDTREARERHSDATATRVVPFLSLCDSIRLCAQSEEKTKVFIFLRILSPLRGRSSCARLMTPSPGFRTWPFVGEYCLDGRVSAVSLAFPRGRRKYDLWWVSKARLDHQ